MKVKRNMTGGRHRRWWPAVGIGLAVSLMVGCGSADQVQRSGSHQSGNGDAVSDVVEKDHHGSLEHEDHIDFLVQPPKEYYDALFVEALEAAENFSLADSKDQVLWVNFDGATVYRGYNKGQSFIPCKSVSTIPSSGLSASQRETVLAMVQEDYNDTGAKLVVTQTKPTSGDFTTIHVGGSYRDIGCAGSGILGIAPYDVGNRNRNDIGYAFVRGISNLRTIADTVSHEAGHSFGLTHVQNRKDIMYPSINSAIIGFQASRVQGSTRIQDAPAVLRNVLGLGTYTPGPQPTDPTDPSDPDPTDPTDPVPPQPTPQPTQPPQPDNPIGDHQPPKLPDIPGLPNIPNGLDDILGFIPGLDIIGAIGQLLPGIGGLDLGNILNLGNFLPNLGSIFNGSIFDSLGNLGGLPGLDKIFTLIGLAAHSDEGAESQKFLGGGIPAAISVVLATEILSNLSDFDVNSVTELINLNGFGDLPGALGSLGQAFQDLLGGVLGGGGSGSTPKAPDLGGIIQDLPDLAVILGLINDSGIPIDLGQILKGLPATAKVIEANYSGEDRAALMSMVKLAYSQAYERYAELNFESAK